MLVRVTLSLSLLSTTFLSICSDLSLLPELILSTSTPDEGAILGLDSLDPLLLPESADFGRFLSCFLVELALSLGCNR